jgi:hypothetical protein
VRNARCNRDHGVPSNWAVAKGRALVNYTTRPLWLVRDENRGGNDFVTGFSPEDGTLEQLVLQPASAAVARGTQKEEEDAA